MSGTESDNSSDDDVGDLIYYLVTRKVAVAILLGFLATHADASTIRSNSAKAEFKRLHPCPATGARNGPCGGYVIDHVKRSPAAVLMRSPFRFDLGCWGGRGLRIRRQFATDRN
jgi:hypothetical protein